MGSERRCSAYNKLTSRSEKVGEAAHITKKVQDVIGRPLNDILAKSSIYSKPSKLEALWEIILITETQNPKLVGKEIPLILFTQVEVLD